MSDVVAAAVEGGDLDRLVRLVDGLCGSREWDQVVRLRDRCRQALQRGLQLWPAAEYAEYRLALDAPGEYAGPVVREGAGRFALGPLWEVAASTHAWEDLDRHLPAGPMRAMAAHERVIRGEDLSMADGIDPSILEVPLRLESWEPGYPPAVYRPDKADFPTPPAADLAPVALPPPGPLFDDEPSIEALYDLGRGWVEQSNGACRAVGAVGGALEVITHFGYERVRVGRVTAATALAWMAWSAASGGAYGRRSGTPSGRFAAWWAAAQLTGLEWPPEPGELGEAIDGLEWHLWEPRGLVGGWGLHLAAADPIDGIAWAMAATDTYREDDPNRPAPDD
ncbi:MAG: hypothetical protein KJ698_05865 [Actinobacteria bacterium]|nr:hypothetical protein [Actinomycetota bacterium]